MTKVIPAPQLPTRHQNDWTEHRVTDYSSYSGSVRSALSVFVHPVHGMFWAEMWGSDLKEVGSLHQVFKMGSRLLKLYNDVNIPDEVEKYIREKM